LTIVKRLVALHRGSSTWVCPALTATRPSDRRQAQEAGFDAHLTKPVSPPDLAAILISKG
jgi:CheY-like chemotaxis protein